MELKVGDKVIVKRRQSDIEDKGTIVEIRRYKDVKETLHHIPHHIPPNDSNAVYFYAVIDDREIGTRFGWSYNVFNFDKIWLDTERMREEKLNNILK